MVTHRGRLGMRNSRVVAVTGSLFVWRAVVSICSMTQPIAGNVAMSVIRTMNVQMAFVSWLAQKTKHLVVISVSILPRIWNTAVSVTINALQDTGAKKGTVSCFVQKTRHLVGGSVSILPRIRDIVEHAASFVDRVRSASMVNAPTVAPLIRPSVAPSV